MNSEKKTYLKLNPYLEITSGINAVLAFSEGVIKVIGKGGSGKSAICHLLLDEMTEEGLETVLFVEVPDSPQKLENTIQNAFALEKNIDFPSALTNYLIAKPSQQQKLILIFDDAEGINDETFQIISQLTDIKHNFTPLISVVLCGADVLNQKLDEPDKQALLEKIILSLQIHPMNRNELEAFCNAYMDKLGLDADKLNEADYSAILEASEGYPKKVPELIYELIDKGLTERAATKNNNVDKGLVGKLVELDDDPEPELKGLSVADREEVLMNFKEQVPWRWQSNGVAIAVVVLFVVVAYGWFGPKPDLLQVVIPSLSDAQIAVEEPVSEEPVIFIDDVPVQELENVVVIEETPVDAAELVDTTEAQTETLELVSADIEEFPVGEGLAQADGVVARQTENVETVENDVEEMPAETQALVEVEVEVENITIQAEVAVDEIELANAGESEELVRNIPSSEPRQTVAVNQNSATSKMPSDRFLVEPRRFIEDWVSAWEDQNIEGYFDHYQDMFVPDYHASRSSWQGDRRLKISRPNYIKLDVEGMELVDFDSNGLTVRFWLSYVSSYYKDRTLKEVQLTENGLGEFLIAQEKNLQVEILPYYPR